MSKIIFILAILLLLGCEEEEPENIERPCDWGYSYEGLCWVHRCYVPGVCKKLSDETNIKWRQVSNEELQIIAETCDGEWWIPEAELTDIELDLCYDADFDAEPPNDMYTWSAPDNYECAIERYEAGEQELTQPPMFTYCVKEL